MIGSMVDGGVGRDETRRELSRNGAAPDMDMDSFENQGCGIRGNRLPTFVSINRISDQSTTCIHLHQTQREHCCGGGDTRGAAGLQGGNVQYLVYLVGSL